MSTIEDLKKQHVSASVSVGEPEYGDRPTNLNKIPVTVKRIPEPPVQTPTSSVSVVPMTGSEATKEIKLATEHSSNRVSADFSSIPKTDGSENLGVDIKESMESEIFKKGGMFDQYVKEKVQEVDQWYKEETAKAQKKAAEEAEKKENEENSYTIEEEEDVETTIPPATNGRVIDISRKEKKSNMKVTAKIEKNIEPVEEIIEEVDEVEEDLPEEVEDEYEDSEKENNIDYEDLDDEVTEEETVNEVIKEETSEIHNAEEIISEEPIKEEKKSNIADKIDRVTRRIMSVDIDDEDLDDDDENANVETESEDDQMEILKSLVSQKIVPVAKSLDISSFAIAKKPTSSNSIFETKEAAIAKWVLPATGITIMLREISGANLENMRSLLSRRIPDMRGALKIIYDHVVSPKPDSFDNWMKSIAFADYDNLFMAIYIAAFAESNFLPIDCAECGKPYLTDDIEIMDMVKFKDEESEEKFTKLYNSDAVNPNGLYVTENVAISEKFAIAFREPSIYSVLIESQYFDDKFNRRYQQTIAIMPYIDQVFYIDVENRRLVPIEFKLIANDPAKTARLKIKKLDAILNTLTVDQNAILATFTQKINERTDWFTYQIPASTCPNCKHENPAAEDQSASSLVFLRNRLGALATI